MKSFDPVYPVSAPRVAMRHSPEDERGALAMLVSFERLAKVFCAVRQLCRCVAVLAILWMHPKHPIHPVQEKLMREEVEGVHVGVERGRMWSGVRALQEAGVHVARAVWCMLNAVNLSLRLVHLHWLLRHEISVLRRQQFDVVVKTWCFGSARPADDPDFYYGDLQRRLAKRGVRMLLLCGNADSQDWRTFAKAHVATSNSCRLPELCLVHPLAPVLMAFRQVLASLKLRRVASRVYEPLMRRVSELASRDCLLRATTALGLFFWIGRTAVKTWHPRAFVSLYEGHGWEKCAWWGAKVADSVCRTVGYQHTVLFPQTISLLRPHLDQREGSVPDVVLCTGESTKRMMQPGHPPRHSQLITFGSFRRTVDDELNSFPLPQKRTVLVVPEGYLDEEKLLFEVATRVAALLPDHHFIFRCHPFLPFDNVRPHLEHFPGEFPNIEISDRESIADDFSRSSVVLYRGSSSVLYAVLHGLKPICFHNDQHHYVDALFELTSWREYASSVSELVQILRRYAATTEECATEEWRSAVEYVNTYTMPVDDASIDRFLTAVGLPTGMAAA